MSSPTKTENRIPAEMYLITAGCNAHEPSTCKSQSAQLRPTIFYLTKLHVFRLYTVVYSAELLPLITKRFSSCFFKNILNTTET